MFVHRFLCQLWDGIDKSIVIFEDIHEYFNQKQKFLNKTDFIKFKSKEKLNTDLLHKPKIHIRLLYKFCSKSVPNQNNIARCDDGAEADSPSISCTYTLF